MKILFVVPYVPSLIRVRPYQFIRQLSGSHAVSVLAVGGGAQDAGAVRELEGLCHTVQLVRSRLSTSLRSCAAAALRGEPLQAAVCRSPELEHRLRGLIAESGFDVVHIEHLRAAHVSACVPAHLPTVFDAVDCISLLQQRTLRSSHSLRQRGLAALELRRTRTYEAKLLGRFDRVAVTSADDARALLALAPGAQVAVVPNGVDLDYFHPLWIPPRQATLVFSGKMSYHANVSAVLHFVDKILPLVRHVRPDVRLKIVGSNPPRSVQALARDPGISFTGHLADIRPAVAEASVAVCPVTVKVGIQNKVLEAMAMGVPVVATREGAEGLQAQPGRDLLVAADPIQFAQQVCHLLANPALRAGLGRAGRTYVETHHRWSTASERLQLLYGEALRAAASAREC